MLKKRLSKVYDMVTGRVPLDIGCDHAYLSIELVKNGKCLKAYCSDNKLEPLNNAINNIKEALLEDKIKAILSDGLKDIYVNDFDTITITGMGADNIINIINNRDLSGIDLILGANNNHDLLRAYLVNNGYSIIDEDIVYDSDFYYQIIKSRYTGKNTILNKKELLYGPINLKNKSDELKGLIKFQIKILEDALTKTDSMEVKDKYNFLMEVLNEIK